MRAALKEVAFTVAMIFAFVGMSISSCSRGQDESRSVVISYGGGPILGSLFRKSPYAVDIEGSGRTKLRLPEHLGDRYSWSPDGNWVISISHYPATADSEYRADVIIIPVDEGPSHQIVSDGSTKWDPAWGPNGEYIAYHANAPESRIYLANVGCIYEQDDCQIEPFALVAGESPDWSPDGTKIVFHLDGWLNTVVIETRNITELQVKGARPVWSPDGGRIAFQRETDIYILDLDSGEISNVTNGIGRNGRPRWSPGGEEILFISSRDGLGKALPWGEYTSNGLFKMDLTTGSVIRLSEYDDIRITWYAIIKE